MKTARERAKSVIGRRVKTGTPRKVASASYSLASLGSIRIYQDVLTLYLQWVKDNGIPFSAQDHKTNVELYLEECSEFYRQATLNMHRNVLSQAFQIKGISKFRSKIPTHQEPRSYTWEQIKKIVQFQSEANALSTLIAYYSGVRAHELSTLKPLELNSRSRHPQWRHDLFFGISDFQKYVVTGKGGLSREVAIPLELSDELESRRISEKIVVDRGIRYKMMYDIGYGQSLSQSFSCASNKALGFSNGFHGTRHSYAKQRYNILKKQGKSDLECQHIISQEMGHFRIQITHCYFR